MITNIFAGLQLLASLDVVIALILGVVGDILVGDKDGIVVIRRQDAAAVAEVAQKKKAAEDKTFELMERDLAAYAEKHLQTTAQRMEGKKVETFGSYAELYSL